MSQRLHEDEVHIDVGLVRELIRTQLPRLADLEVRLVAAPGTDNVVFRLGDELSVRLPRKPAAVSGLLIEREWLPRLAAHLPLAVPEPRAAGEPSEIYPFCLARLQLGQRRTRAGPVAAYDMTARAALNAAGALQAAGRVEPDMFDEERAAAVWAAAVQAPKWQDADVWVHRDFMASNLVTLDGRLHGVLDFGGLAVGDPAGNAMAAFHVFDSADSRSRFWAALGTDDATWARARGWALTQGLEALVYYFDSHPGMVAMARQVIRATLETAD